MEPDARWPWAQGPDRRNRVLATDITRALRGAHRLLVQRAEQRARELAAHTAQARVDALARVDDYYEAALATIARRRQATPDEERRRLLDAQADATRAERDRRRQEVVDEYRTSHELHPFRLHLVLVPAVRLPMVVRRGARTYPLELVKFVTHGGFAPVACPHCGQGAPLVAGRERVGCIECLPRAVPSRPGATRRQPEPADQRLSRAPGQPRPATDSGPVSKAPLAPPRTPGGQLATAPSRRSTRPDPSRRRTRPHAGRARAGDAASARGLRDAGDRLGLKFWREVMLGRRVQRRRTADDSPLRALYRLYGRDGPLVAVGVPPTQWPSGVEVFTADPLPGLPIVTCGRLQAGRCSYPFALRWEPGPSGPVLLELLPSVYARDATLPPRLMLLPDVAGRLFGPASTPAGLDPVAEQLWSIERSIGGLSLVLRCFAAWWRVASGGQGDYSAPALAAAVASLVASRSGIRRPRAAAAAEHGVDVEAVNAAARRLQRRLQLSSDRGW